MFNEPEEKPRFWSRQFSNEITSHQRTFDVIFGVILPILCFVYDPIVFRNNFGGPRLGPNISQFKLLVYFFSALSIFTLVVWLISRGRGDSLNAIIAGILFSGAFFSALIGVLILPLTLVGLLFLIGVLGFIPFLTALVYLRNGIRAFKAAKPLLAPPLLTVLFLLGAFLVIGSSTLLHWQTNRLVTDSMNDLLTGDVRRAEFATQKLRYFGWAIDLDRVVLTYSRERDQAKKDALAKAYRDITGEDISDRLMVLMD